MIEIELFLSRTDNYGVLVRDDATGKVAAIDAPDAEAIEAALARRNWPLDMILITHRHFDHIEGVAPLVAQYGCPVIAPHKARHEIPNAAEYVSDGDEILLGETRILVWETPGHCADHVSYHVPSEHVIFVGDTLFTMGCGRIFDSSAEALFGSLARINALPGDTQIYCGHEYTLANARFAAQIEPDNPAIIARLAVIEQMRAQGQFTVPTSLRAEQETNVFLRARTVQILAERRDAKNRA
jgi:hydroxyacylglutathione hydrolase